jgi:hypothetical protein
MTETKSSLLRFCIAFALRGVRLRVGQRFARLALNEQQRYEAADKTLDEMRRFGGWKELDDPIESKLPGPSWMGGKPGDSNR